MGWDTLSYSPVRRQFCPFSLAFLIVTFHSGQRHELDLVLERHRGRDTGNPSLLVDAILD